MALLTDAGIPVTARRSFGVEIDAACGQLYAKYAPKPPKKTKTLMTDNSHSAKI
jgi:hypothetical protein